MFEGIGVGLGLGSNPLGVLTFIVAPAVLTNASSINALTTSNRLARAADRARELSGALDAERSLGDPWYDLHLRILRYAEKRLKLLVRALTAFYASVGSFAAASMLSLVGALCFMAGQPSAGHVSTGMSLVAGLGGMSGLVYGSWLLVRETRTTLVSLSEETQFILTQHLTAPPLTELPPGGAARRAPAASEAVEEKLP